MSETEEGSSRAILAALASNIGVALSKFVAFLFTSSSSMLAESLHSAADTIDQVLLLVGGRRSQRAATRLHPFGFGQFRYLYAFLVAIVIFVAGGAFALFEGVEKVTDPKPIESPAWAIGVLVAALFLEGYSLRTAVKASRAERGGNSFLAFIRGTKTPEIPVVMLEDFGALIGLVLALVAVTLTVLTGNGVWDGVGSLGIGLLLFGISGVLATEIRSLLLNESASDDVLEAISAALSGGELITHVIHLRTMHLGPDQLLVTAKVAVPPESTAVQIAAAINAAEERIRSDVELQCTIYLEPDVLSEDMEQESPAWSAVRLPADS